MGNKELLIQTHVVTGFQQNCRLLIETNSKTAMLVDPGGDLDKIFSAIESQELNVESVFLTHAHLDHGGGVAAALDHLEKIQGKRPVFYSCGEEESFMRNSLEKQGVVFGVGGVEFKNAPEPDVVLKDGDILDFAGFSAKTLFTPGHSPGHLALFFDTMKFKLDEKIIGLEGEYELPVLIAGDTLFAGSVGRTDLPGGDYETLIDSIENKIMTLPDNTLVLSGHGPSTSVGHERKNNPFL